GRTLVIFPRVSSIQEKIMIEKDLLDENRFLTDRLRPLGLDPVIHLVDIDLKPEAVSAAAAAASQAEQTLLFVYDAHIMASNKQLLDAVQGSVRRLAVVLLRDVYD